MEPGNLESRVTALEHQVRDFRADTAANLAALRSSTTASFSALREDFVDLRSHMDEGFAKVDQEFAKVDRGFTEIRGRLDATAAGQQQIVDLLQSFTGNPGSDADE